LVDIHHRLVCVKLTGKSKVKILITAGNTQSPVDRVRCVTNIFSGKTGTRIAVEAAKRGYSTTIATSHPELATTFSLQEQVHLDIKPYRTFDDLEKIMRTEITEQPLDCIIHAAAVNDYHTIGVYSLADGSEFSIADQTIHGPLLDVQKGKVKGSHRELWIRMTPAPKLVDKIRSDWEFKGKLVKFKLEVGLTKTDLIAVGEESRLQSHADILVANTLERMNEWAIILEHGQPPKQVVRSELASELLDTIDKLLATQ
jgi:phosphopantothenate---cysteine ligase (CTP)